MFNQTFRGLDIVDLLFKLDKQTNAVYYKDL